MPAPVLAAVAQGARAAAQTTAKVAAKVGQQTAKVGAKVGAKTARAGGRLATRAAKEGGKRGLKAGAKGARSAGRSATSRSGRGLGRSRFRKKGRRSLKDRAKQRLKDEARQSGGDDEASGSGRGRPRSKVGRARAALAGAGQQASRQASQALTGDGRARSYTDADQAVARATGTVGRGGGRGAARLASKVPKAATFPVRFIINKFRIMYRVKRARRRFRRLAVVLATLLVLLLLAPLSLMPSQSDDEMWATLLPALICQDIEDGNITLTGTESGNGSVVPVEDPAAGLPEDFDVEAAMGAFLVVETTWVDGEPNWNNAEGSYWGAYQFSDTEWEEDGDPQYLPLDPGDLPPPEAQHDYARTRITRLLRHYLDLYDGEVPWDVIVPVVWMPGQGWISRLRGSEIDEGDWLVASGKNPTNRNYRQLWLNAYDQIRQGGNPTHDSIAPPGGSYLSDHPEYTPVGQSHGTASGGGGGGPGIDVSGAAASGDLSSCASTASATGAAAQWTGGPLGSTGRYTEGGLYSGLQTLLNDVIPQFGNQGIHCIRPGDPGAHGQNRACDLPAMPECCWNGAVPDASHEAYGHALARYLVANADRLGVDCVIWWGRIWNRTRDTVADRDWFEQRSYGTRYSNDGPGQGRDHFTSTFTTTQGHYDHVHVSVTPRVGGRC